MKIAVIGAGISGLSCAWKLEQGFAARGERHHRVTLFEAGDHFGGHSNTVDIGFHTEQGYVEHGVDTGFLVFNQRTYPQLIQLFSELDVPVAASDMSFAVSIPELGLEWAGGNFDTVFAQRRNLVNPRFLRMLRDIVRFNRLATALAQSGTQHDQPALSIGDFLALHRFSDEFRDWYFLPMAGCIWSCPTRQMLDFPAGTMIRFCYNHGLLQLRDRPQWMTVRGGSRIYVERMLTPLRDARLDPVLTVRRPAQPDGRGARAVQIVSAGGIEDFDEVVFACHSDQALALLADPSVNERAILGAVKYQPNRAVLHTDAGLLPARRKTWSAWNYTSRLATPSSDAQVCVHYLLNRLQPLPAAWGKRPVIVSLNPVAEPGPGQVLRQFDYAHPVFDATALAAQRELPQLQGLRHSWFCGAWTGFGFHEDGLVSGLNVARHLAALTALRSGNRRLAA